LKRSDRFYYENGSDNNTRFTLNQLNEIRSKATMKEIICRNGDVDKIQAFSFLAPHQTISPFVDCNLIDTSSALSLYLWKE